MTIISNLIYYHLSILNSYAKQQEFNSTAFKSDQAPCSALEDNFAGAAENSKKDPFKMRAEMADMNLPFIANEGQVDKKARFYSQTFGGTVFVTENGEIVYSLPRVEKETGKEKAAKGVGLKESFVGSEVKEIVGMSKTTTEVNYFKGADSSKWRTNIPTYGFVDLGEVYQGIGMILRAHGNNVEKIFTVKPGADPEKIRIKMSGAKTLKTNPAGELKAETDLGAVTFSKPLAYQEIEGQRRYVEVIYITDKTKYGFYVSDYDREKELIIDPVLASTYLGGTGNDYGYAITINQDGDVYVTGSTTSTNFPTTSGAFDTSFNTAADVFVTRLNSNLSAVISSTYLGGSGADFGYGIARDENGNVYVTGSTASTNFPTTSGAFAVTKHADADAFVSKLDPNITTLIASTYLGGGGNDYARAIKVDGSGNVCVGGYTGSANFPTTSGAFDTTKNANADGFVTKLNSSLSALVSSTYLGGGGNDYIYALTGDGSGDVYVGGYTGSTNFPTIPGAFDVSKNANPDGFVTKLNSALSALASSTYLGGGGNDYIYAITQDQAGDVYVTGNTTSTNFPTISGAYNTTKGSNSDTFVTRFDPGLSILIASTYIGGGGNDTGNAITVDYDGNVSVTGETTSSNFPTTPGAFDTTKNSNDDAFVSQFNGGLSTLYYSTYLGGSGNDHADAIAINQGCSVYVVGDTNSTNFPTTPDAYDVTENSNSDAFVTRFSFSGTINVPSSCHPTIQAGIDAASDGDVVLVAEGIYTGEGNTNLNFNGKAITLLSESGPEKAIIECQGDGVDFGLSFSSGNGIDSVVEGFTINGAIIAGILCGSGSSPTIQNCIIKNNGRGILCWGSSPAIINSVIANNAATGDGGGILSSYGGNPKITNCTIVNNSSVSGGGIKCNDGPAVIKNSIIWNNSPDQISGSPTVTYSDVQGGTGQPWFGTGCINADPLLAAGFHLQAGSVCRDAADPASAPPACPSDDIDIESRPKGVRYDIGADEFFDSDSDNLPDYWEYKYYGNLAKGWSEDYEGDGLSNGNEYNNSTDPIDMDTEDDGMPDGWEVQYTLNPVQNDADADKDNDSFSNYIEYLGGSNPNNSQQTPSPGCYNRYDALGRLVRTFCVSASQGRYEIEYQYDAVGNRTSKIVH